MIGLRAPASVTIALTASMAWLAPIAATAVGAILGAGGCGLDSSGTGATNLLGDTGYVAPDAGSDLVVTQDTGAVDAGFDGGALDLGADLGPADVADELGVDSASDAGDDAAADVDAWPELFDVGVADGTAPCPEPNSAVFGGHCYFQIGALSWVDAEAACEATSPAAHLVTIGSLGEQTVVVTLATSTRWIGFEAPAPSNAASSFEWVTAEPVTFAQWAIGSPSSAGNCVAMDVDTFWRDRSCDEVDVAICERE